MKPQVSLNQSSTICIVEITSGHLHAKNVWDGLDDIYTKTLTSWHMQIHLPTPRISVTAYGCCWSQQCIDPQLDRKEHRPVLNPRGPEGGRSQGAGRFSGKVLLSTPGTRIEGNFRLVSVGFDESFCQLTSAVNIGSLPNFPEKKAPPPACGGMGKALVRWSFPSQQAAYPHPR